MASIPNPSLNDGLVALKQGNYSEAIAHLKGVYEMELDDSVVSRAALGLVKAYHGIGDGEKAIALCRNLTQDPDPKVKKWADKTLPELTAKYPAPDTPSARNSTGFVPLDGTAAQLPSSKHRTSTTKTSSNFQRLANSTKRLFSQGKTPNPTPQNSSLLPVPYSPSSGAVPSIFTPRPRWRNSKRAKNWRPLKRPKFVRLWLVEIATAIAFFWLLRFVVQFAMRTTNTLLVKLPFFQPIQLFYRDPTIAIYFFLGTLLILSPWLIDGLLKWFDGLEPLSLTQLASRSPEAAQLLPDFCRQRRLPLPKLGILPTDAPVAMTYGNLPWTARIVVSEGLLEQLADNEIATIYAGQLGHIVHWDFILMSLGALIIQLPYKIYWQVARWGENLAELAQRKFPSSHRFLPSTILGISGVVSSLSYGIYWLLSLPLNWFSRVRLYYSDRTAIETTGNPNGLTRALLKIALGITEDIQTFRATSGMLESFNFLLPVGYRQAITLGSCSPRIHFEELLKWDCTNPYHDWLIISSSHPLIGERLHLPNRYAQFLQLDTELNLPPSTPPIRDNAARFAKLRNSYKALPLLQSAVLFGLMLGVILRGLLWGVGKVSDWLNIWQLIWMYNATPFLDGCIMIAFSLCVFVWINSYFPDIKRSNLWREPNLGDFFANPYTLSPDSQPIQLSGKLLGRRSLLNWLGQDLILQTSTGLVKLHFSSWFGPLGNILPKTTRASDLVDQKVTLTGWFRRGATPWIDVETLSTQEGKIARANYPIWITILAVVAVFWGTYQIWQA